MAKDSKALKKMYLLSESTFQKIKDIEDAERHFSTLDKAMKSVLYNNKISNHKKLTQYTALLDKYMLLRKQLVAKYGETEVKRREITNPFEFDKDNFPRLSAMFSTLDTDSHKIADKYDKFDTAPLDTNNFQFNHTIPVEDEEKFDKFDTAVLDQSKMKNFQTGQEEIFTSDERFDNNVNLPPQSVNNIATQSINQDVTMKDMTDDNPHEFVELIWHKRAYPVQKMFIPKFKEFIKKVKIKYPTAVRMSTTDFSNYLINGRVEIKSLERPNPFDIQKTIRKRKSASTLKTIEAKQKRTQITDHFPQRKIRTATLVKPSKLDQVGKGLRKKWISFR